MKKTIKLLLAITMIAFYACSKDDTETSLKITDPETALPDDVFFDSFETGNLLHTNPSGFRWTDSAWITIVNPTKEVWSAGKPIDVPKENAASFPGKDWVAHSAEHSMRFRYPKGEAWSEQRFDLGTPMKDIWIRFWLKVPVNFSYGPVGSPNKFFALWSDAYSSLGEGSTVFLGMHRINDTDADLAITHTPGGQNSSLAYTQNTPFITTSDAGRWMQILWHVKAESSLGSSDGVIQTYRRWDGEESFTKLHESFDAGIKLPPNGPNGFKAGYILGWANAAYTEDTEWLLDDFGISRTAPKGLKLP